MRRDLFAFVSVMFLTASAVFAQHGGDIVLTIEGSGTDSIIVTNLTGGSTIVPQRVFGAELGEDFANFTNEPGFDTAAPGPFTAGSSIGFNILDALRKWDGDDFDAIATETMTVAFGGGIGGNIRTTPAVTETVSGFTLGVSATGTWHRHLEYTLNSPASSGIYLLELDLFSTQGNLDNSLPFYIVFNQNDEDSHEAAVSFVENNLVPEPSSLATLLLGGLVLLRRRNKRAVARVPR